ncbi:hypothetical protein ACPOL_1560 [Acidisarcina polymorpha]|uniref:Uncharacterized protein n=1 Tax=Acidisarcina polymorpha TaxID=2211140 RepID=A0A2Z5FWX9_9BACT|nr:hypothetical protein ACPOL_1560 [Acidisarcina polymorpha]
MGSDKEKRPAILKDVGRYFSKNRSASSNRSQLNVQPKT